MAQSRHPDHVCECPLSGVRRTYIDITGVFSFAARLPPHLPPWPNLLADRASAHRRPGEFGPLFAKHSPPMLLAHFVGDAGPR
jgi:hypothetical protein